MAHDCYCYVAVAVAVAACLIHPVCLESEFAIYDVSWTVRSVRSVDSYCALSLPLTCVDISGRDLKTEPEA